MAGQTVYNTSPDIAFPGMSVDNGPTDDVSFTNEEASGIRAGIMVVQGTEDDDALLPAMSGDEPIGVVMHSHAVDQDLAAPLIVAENGLGSARRKGRVWVYCDEAVALGDPVFFRHTANGGLNVLGAFRNDADTARADALLSARFAGPSQVVNGVNLAPLDINLV